MKITSEKHNHKLTNLLKVFIFSILMLLPFLNVAVRCGYVMLNKNAYQSYYGETINQKQYNFVNVENLENGNTYDFQGYSITAPTTQTSNQFTYLYVLETIDYNNQINYVDDVDYFVLYYSTDNRFICRIYYNNHPSQDISVLTAHFQFRLENGVNLNVNPFLIENNFFYTLTYNSYSYLDNVFEYSLNKLEQEQYLTWTQNTAVYTGVNAMTTGLGITQTVIPMLIVYWFILTIIYIIIDIVLALFTKLTHMIGNKTT